MKGRAVLGWVLGAQGSRKGMFLVLGAASILGPLYMGCRKPMGQSYLQQNDSKQVPKVGNTQPRALGSARPLHQPPGAIPYAGGGEHPIVHRQMEHSRAQTRKISAAGVSESSFNSREALINGKTANISSLHNPWDWSTAAYLHSPAQPSCFPACPSCWHLGFPVPIPVLPWCQGCTSGVPSMQHQSPQGHHFSGSKRWSLSSSRMSDPSPSP